jgi:hypothetical protein
MKITIEMIATFNIFYLSALLLLASNFVNKFDSTVASGILFFLKLRQFLIWIRYNCFDRGDTKHCS